MSKTSSTAIGSSPAPKRVKVGFSATVPLMQYGNITPSIEVEYELTEDDKKTLEERIELLVADVQKQLNESVLIIAQRQINYRISQMKDEDIARAIDDEKERGHLISSLKATCPAYLWLTHVSNVILTLNSVENKASLYLQ